MNYPTSAARLAGAIACVVLFAGCNTTAKRDTATESKAAKEEYVRVHSMGSWVPRKVKKQADLIGDGTREVDAQALERVQAAGHTNVPKER